MCMKVRTVLLSICYAGLLPFCCNAQYETSKDIHTNSNNCSYKKLPEYQASLCISNLLSSVVKSNTRFYKPNKFFYSLTLKHGNNQKYLSIIPDEWHGAKNIDYVGILKIRGVTFLCRGDFDKDSLFKMQSTSFIKVILKQSKDSAYMLPFFTEPSLDGIFNDCNGIPIYVEVYTIGKIAGYEKKIHRSDIKH